MEKSELMKQYEAEREGIMPCGMEIPGGFIYSKEYVTWLEDQLTWRPVSEKPKEGQIVFTMIQTGWVVAQYLNGEFYVDDGFTFGDRISGVNNWLPIPPAPEGGIV